MNKAYETELLKGNYPSRQSFIHTSKMDGLSYQKHLEEKKALLKKIPLPTTTGSFYVNEAYCFQKLKALDEQRHSADLWLSIDLESFENEMLMSEIDASSEIEGQKSSRRKIEESLKKSGQRSMEEQRLFNMHQALQHIQTHTITLASIHELYSILTLNVLSDEEKLEGGIYRSGEVSILGRLGEISDHGVPANFIPSAMEALVKFVHTHTQSLNGWTYLLPALVHYYVIYLHPYYDYNGRMARLMSLWVCLINPYYEDPLPIISEAIQFSPQTKKNYYRAIEHARKDDNDVTYFIDYLLSISQRFNAVYMTLGRLKSSFKRQGILIGANHYRLLKTILLAYQTGEWLGWEDLKTLDKGQYTKQYYLSILNDWTDHGILEKKVHLKTALYRLTDSINE